MIAVHRGVLLAQVVLFGLLAYFVSHVNLVLVTEAGAVGGFFLLLFGVLAGHVLLNLRRR